MIKNTKHIDINIDSGGMSPLNDICTVIEYMIVFYKEKPDVCLFFTTKSNIYGSLAASAMGINYINNISGLGTAFIGGGWLSRILIMLYKISLKNSKMVFFQNKDDQKIFLEKNIVYKDRIDLLPGSGVDLELYNLTSMVEKRTFVFLLVARLIRDKGVLEFVESAKIVRKEFPNAEFQLLGFLGVKNKTAISESQVKHWESKGYVKYLGSTDNVSTYMKDSSCVVLPSYREGTPRTLLEAAALGRPIITTDVPGCREVVDDGINGYLCEVRNPIDLAEKMKRMISLSDKERQDMSLRGREKMENEFDDTIVSTKYLDTINEILVNK